MTEIEIRNEARNYMEIPPIRAAIKCGDLEDLESHIKVAFANGARWALENQWHDTSKELPCNSAEIKKDFDVTEYVLCIGRNGYCFTDYMAFSHKDKTWKWAKDFIVMFWMSIPSLPKDIIHT